MDLILAGLLIIILVLLAVFAVPRERPVVHQPTKLKVGNHVLINVGGNFYSGRVLYLDKDKVTLDDTLFKQIDINRAEITKVI